MNTKEEFLGLAFCSAVFNESFRLRPAATFLFLHCAVREVVAPWA